MSNFRAADQLLIGIGGGGGYNAKASLDSDGNGRVNGVDEDVRLVGGDLVLDVDASYERFTGQALDFLGDQHIVLQHVTAFDADQLV